LPIYKGGIGWKEVSRKDGYLKKGLVPLGGGLFLTYLRRGLKIKAFKNF